MSLWGREEDTSGWGDRWTHPCKCDTRGYKQWGQVSEPPCPWPEGSFPGTDEGPRQVKVLGSPPF